MLPILIGKSLPKLDNLKVVVKNIYSVLVTFKLNLFARSESLTRVRSEGERKRERERGRGRESQRIGHFCNVKRELL